MLQRLDLIGFKSFAEKTTFEFSPGLTAIVGPNGSGKSNIVDAIRWVLGEQSSKSLRGQEMVDVIFNGSATRRSLGLAEVVMTFDNSAKSLASEAGQVQIARRIYRDGQSEYLINGEVQRLKDVRDLFLGSGAGGDAYCIIEQGRVEVLLQSSTKDRRAIFEEAAGISRFKVKKIETLRKLERVNQNLDRVRDILEELEKQLRSVQLQAAKAQRYQEHQSRLRGLRIALALRDCSFLDDTLKGEESTLDSLRNQLQEQARANQVQENQLRSVEEELARVDDRLRSEEQRITAIKQKIATAETTRDHERESATALEADLADTRTRLIAGRLRVDSMSESLRIAAAELALADRQFQVHGIEVQKLENAEASIGEEIKADHERCQQEKAAQFETVRQAAAWHNEAAGFKARYETLVRERDRLSLQANRAADHLAAIDRMISSLSTEEMSFQERLDSLRGKEQEIQEQARRKEESLEGKALELADLRAERKGFLARAEVLQGLEASKEGWGAGPREVAEHLLAYPEASAFLLGMVADVISVSREHAAWIELALGEMAQCFLVRDQVRLDELLNQRSGPFSGRVSFVFLNQGQRSPHGEGIFDANHIVARAADLVTCDHPELRDLPDRLLGDTLVVKDLETARRLAQENKGFRFLTVDHELLEANGMLTVGVHHAETGIISRKVELRELREQIKSLEVNLEQIESQLSLTRIERDQLEAQAEWIQQEIQALNGQTADLKIKVGQHRQQRQGLSEEVSVSQKEIALLDQEIQSFNDSWIQAEARAKEAEQIVKNREKQIAQMEGTIRQKEERRQDLNRNLLAAKVAQAQIEERRRSLVTQYEKQNADLDQRRQEWEQGEAHRQSTQRRLQECLLAILKGEGELASAYGDKETAEQQSLNFVNARIEWRRQRQELLESTQTSRQQWEAKREEVHHHELGVNDLKHRRQTLLDRIREDYQLDLADEAARSEAVVQITPLTTDLEAQETQTEIEELRRKLTRLGNVNLEALQELTELEARARSLREQAEDLKCSQKSLEEIIAKINLDSRKMFIDTFEAIRGHFQELFRKLFGGGMADMILEDTSDVLECGIEIIARPPGKEMRSLSLMSGGEKTLTAVALLLAIFRSKPSPFCILDEVDAPLDEANIGRFTAVLREFLDRSQFILITHSKRTMASADVLYGITMQESGVSKRVAVRFEDWPEELSADQAVA